MVFDTITLYEYNISSNLNPFEPECISYYTYPIHYCYSDLNIVSYSEIRPILVEHSPHIHPYYTINSQLQETTENLPI